MASRFQVKRYFCSLVSLLLVPFLAGCGSMSSDGGGRGVALSSARLPPLCKPPLETHKST